MYQLSPIFFFQSEPESKFTSVSYIIMSGWIPHSELHLRMELTKSDAAGEEGIKLIAMKELNKCV